MIIFSTSGPGEAPRPHIPQSSLILNQSAEGPGGLGIIRGNKVGESE